MSSSRRKATAERTVRKRLQVEHPQRPPISLNVLSASRKKSETTAWPLASCTVTMGMVHTKAMHWQTVVGQMLLCARRLFAVTVTKTSVHQRNWCCVRLCVHVLVRVPARVVFFVCVLVCESVCVRLCACRRVCQFCKTRYWKYWLLTSPRSVLGERCHMF